MNSLSVILAITLGITQQESTQRAVLAHGSLKTWTNSGESPSKSPFIRLVNLVLSLPDGDRHCEQFATRRKHLAVWCSNELAGTHELDCHLTVSIVIFSVI